MREAGAKYFGLIPFTSVYWMRDNNIKNLNSYQDESAARFSQDRSDQRKNKHRI
jgi:hypothetical protein